jgi:hypothetical protein
MNENSSKKKDWKSNLLSSGLPLEFEAAKILRRNGFAYDVEYSYKRKDESGFYKDFSVDIDSYYALPKKKRLGAFDTFSLLVECKYRHENTKWLFAPDTNNKYINRINSSSIRCIDFASSFRAEPPWNFRLIDLKLITCLKGVEINGNSGEAYEKAIVSGISQLKYALPSIIAREIDDKLSGHEADAGPFYICPILLTTAKLYVLQKGCTINQIRNAETLEEISTEVPYLKYYSDPSPDLEEHLGYSFQHIVENEIIGHRLNYLDDLWLHSKEKIYFFQLPSYLIRNLDKNFNQYTSFLVCNFNHFDGLVKTLKKDVLSSANYPENLVKAKSKNKPQKIDRPAPRPRVAAGL